MDYKEAIRKFAKSGGDALKKKYPREHFIEIGKKGASKRWSKKEENSTGTN